MLFIVSLLALTMFSSVVLSETEEFNGEILSGESIDIDDFTFIITMNKYANAIFIDADPMFQTVQLYGCKDMESFRICFENTTYDEEENELYAIVQIYRSKPEVSITRTINETDLLVGQEAEVTITMEATGGHASQIIMTDDYPVSIEIYDLEGGCRVHENQVYWQGHLDEGDERECRFIIKGTEELHQSFTAHLKYWDGFKWVNEYSSTLTLDFESVISVYSAIVREDYEVDGTTFDFDEENPDVDIGETFRLIVNITNEYGDDIDVSAFDINLPVDSIYQSVSHLRFNYINSSGNRSSFVWSSDRISKVSNNVLRWKGTIGNFSSKLFIVKLKAVKSGSQSILVQTKYEYDDMAFQDNQYEDFIIRDAGIGIRLTVDDESKRFSSPVRLDDDEDTDEEDNIDIEALHPYRFRIYTQNKNKYSALEDVDVTVITDLAGFKKVHYDEIAKEGQKIPYSVVLIPPQVGSNKEFPLNVSVTYKNDFGERYMNYSEFKINVQPNEDLSIGWDSSEGEVLEGGEETEVTVSVDNQRLVDIKEVQVTDTIPSEFHIEGVHAKKVKLNKETDTDIYRYRLIPPIVHEKTRYEIVTNVSFFDPDLKQTITYIEVTEITVEPLKPDISVDLTIDEPDDVYMGMAVPVEVTVGNDEELEIVRDITVFFPLQEEFDLVGPKTFFIDKLDPGEEVTIKNILKIRPKVAGDAIKLNNTVVEYYDNYGNRFDENSTEETMDVIQGRVNAPSIFMRTIAPQTLNKSTDGKVMLEVKNNGTIAADVTVEQGDQAWDVTVDAGSTSVIEYVVRYDTEGNYSIPDPVATVRAQGIEAHTKGSGADVKVTLMLPGAVEEVEEAEAVEAVKEEVIPEKEEMSFEEYESLKGVTDKAALIRYGLIAVIAIVVLVIIAFIINNQRKKGPTVPFAE